MLQASEKVLQVLRFVAKTRMWFETGLLLGFSLSFWHKIIFVAEKESHENAMDEKGINTSFTSEDKWYFRSWEYKFHDLECDFQHIYRENSVTVHPVS